MGLTAVVRAALSFLILTTFLGGLVACEILFQDDFSDCATTVNPESSSGGTKWNLVCPLYILPLHNRS